MFRSDWMSDHSVHMATTLRVTLSPRERRSSG